MHVYICVYIYIYIYTYTYTHMYDTSGRVQAPGRARSVRGPGPSSKRHREYILLIL